MSAEWGLVLVLATLVAAIVVGVTARVGGSSPTLATTISSLYRSADFAANGDLPSENFWHDKSDRAQDLPGAEGALYKP